MATGGPAAPKSQQPRANSQELLARRAAIESAMDPDTPRSRAPRDPTQPVSSSVLDDAPYVELHLHSNYSLLEGASSLDELVATAVAQGHRALALTDHDGLFGAMEFAWTAKEARLRPITGLEITLLEEDGTRSHLTLLAETGVGYAHLCRLSSYAFGLEEEDAVAKEERRLDALLPVGRLEEHAGGLIALSGCREGRVPQLLAAGKEHEAEEALRRLVRWFGRASVFVELQDNFVFGDRPRNHALVALAERVGVGVVGTGDVHYHVPARHRLQDVMVAIHHRKTLDESHEERRPNAEFYLRSPAEQAKRFAAYHPEAATNSVRIARRCTFDLTEDLGYRLPNPKGLDGAAPLERLERICHERLEERYPDTVMSSAFKVQSSEKDEPSGPPEPGASGQRLTLMSSAFKVQSSEKDEPPGPPEPGASGQRPTLMSSAFEVQSSEKDEPPGRQEPGASGQEPPLVSSAFKVQSSEKDEPPGPPEPGANSQEPPRERPPTERELAMARLEDELALVGRHDLAGFFLIYHDIIELATEVAAEVRGKAGRSAALQTLPPGRGRGSSVSSIICYLIGLSHIDPIRNNLFVGRFLNDVMRSLPDIDLDFPRDIRAELIERVYERWGKDHAALVAIFPTYRLRSAIRDVGKALGLPAAELDRLAKRASGHDSVHDLPAELARQPEFADRLEARGWRDLSDLAQELAGFPRHLSQHVGGMVISSDPLIDYVPCQPAAWPNRYLCHWDKDSIDDARMVKIDFLALGMLSCVEETVDLVARQRGHALDLSRIDFEEEATYDAICEGDTVGVFQIESRAQIAMLPRTQPRTLEDLTVQVSLVRPGPIVGGAVNPYVRRREKQRENPHYVPEVPHECVREILAETLGVVIYQEQVIQVAQAMGGFSAGEADQFRRAMSRKRSLEAMERYRQRFLGGARERGVDGATAERVFENLLGFAEFGFPKSHGAAFGLLAYQSTWLKRHYGPEFMCALFNNQPMGFYPPHVLTNDALRHGIQVRRPHINHSLAACTVEELDEGEDGVGAVRVGLGYVKGVGEAGGTRIEEERGRAGDFQSLFDFVQRAGISRRATTSLIRIGAFAPFGLNRRELLWQLGLFGGGFERAMLSESRERQMRLPLPTAQDNVTLVDFNAYQRMSADYELLSLSPDSHPMRFLRPLLHEGVVSSQHLRSLPGGEVVEVAGLVVCRQRPMTARGIIFLLLEDEFGLMNILVSKELAERMRDTVRTAAFVRTRGVLEKRAGEQRTLVAQSLEEMLPHEALKMPSGKSWG